MQDKKIGHLRHPAHAGFWKRLAALVIDVVVLMVVRMCFSAIALLIALGSDEREAIINCAISLLAWLYFAGMESSRHQGTLGKMAVGIKVTDLSGRPIGFGRASGRYFGKIISAIILGIGFLCAAFTPKKQALHDMLAGCLCLR